LAARLDVSRTTISEAKRLLAERGIIAKHEGMYYVA
jgi:DNA-binding GntR family transcriptional regulator